MPVALSAIRNELLPGLRKITGKYPEIPAQWSKYYLQQGKSKMAVERTSSMRFLGLAELKNEGAPTAFDNASGDRYIFNQIHNEIALGYAITRKAIDDNLYKQQFQPSNLGLQRSFNQTKEILGANVLNTATTFNASIAGDGVALLSGSHPVDGNTFANTPSTQVDLNEAAIYSGLIQIRQFLDNAGLRYLSRGRKLLVPIQLEYVAARLTKTELRPGTADNDINALLVTNGLREGYESLDFLTSSFAWFMLTTADEGLLYLERVAYETDMQVDFVTDNLLVKGYERYSFGYDGPRGIWGSTPTS